MRKPQHVALVPACRTGTQGWRRHASGQARIARSPTLRSQHVPGMQAGVYNQSGLAHMR